MTSPVTSDVGAPGGSMDRIARGGTANLLGAAVTAFATFALTVAVTRGLSRQEAGVFFSATSLFLVATTIGQLGTQTGIVYFLSRCRVLRRAETIDSYLRTALTPVLWLAVAMAVAIFVLARPLAELTSPKHAGEATTYLRVLAAFIPVAGFEAAMLAATRGLGSMRFSAIIEQVSRPLGQLLLVIAATFTASTALVGTAWAIGYVPAAAAAWLAWRALRSKYPRPGPERQDKVGRAFWRFTLPRALTSVIQMLMQRFDIVLVGALSGAVPAAIYAAATRWVVVGQLGTNALSLAAQPQLAERLATHDHRGANELYQISTAWLILVTWPLYFVLILFAKPLLGIFGSGYSSGQQVILLISLSMLLGTGLGMVDTVLSMAGHTSWNLGNAVLALGVQLGLDIWLIPVHGIIGAAIGWASAIAVRNIAAVTQVGIALRYHPLAGATMAAAGLTALCYLGLAGASRMLVGATPLGLLVGVLAGTAVFVCGLWRLRGVLRLEALSAMRRRTR
jgi:O-antigen/teichoic acid export membrane protein